MAHRAEPCMSRLRRCPPVSTRRAIPRRRPPPIVPQITWTLNMQVKGGPAISQTNPFDVEAYQVLEIVLQKPEKPKAEENRWLPALHHGEVDRPEAEPR